jgi:subtilisin family serine protease
MKLTFVLSRARLMAASVLFVVGVTMAAIAAGQGGGAPQREHLLVGFTKTPGAAEHALVERYGGTVRFSFPSVNALAIDLDGAKIGVFAREGGISYVEKDPVRKPLGLADAQLTPSISNGLYGLITTQALDAQALGYTGAGVKACVADTGLDTTHPDIAANFVAGKDIFGGTNSVDVFKLGVAATETHATHVSGILLGVNNNVGILGVATQAKLYEARVLGTQPDGSVSGETSQVMAGVQWLADQGCKVINMSLGGGDRSATEQALYEQLIANGHMIVASSGNDGANHLSSFPGAYDVVVSVGAVDRNNAHASFSNAGGGLDLSAPGVDVLSSVPNGQGFEASVTTTQTFEAFGLTFAGTTRSRGITKTLINCGLAGSPSDCPSTVRGNIALISRGSFTFAQKVASAMTAGAVGAIIYNNAPGNFHGTLGTPTNNGKAWIPAVSVSQADGLVLVGQVGSSATLVNAVSSWDFFNGTSMAAPHVSGVAAMVFGKNPNLTPTQVESILENTALDLGPLGYDPTFGFGLVQAVDALNATPLP